MTLFSRYLAYCPNCGGAITEERLQAGLACETCQPDISHPPAPGRLSEVAALQEKIAHWEQCFTQHIGTSPWPLQRTWAVRVLSGRSFAMLAPTGIGKTTFGLVTALWLSRRGKRSFLIFPTRLLVEQAAGRLQKWGADFIAYRGRQREKDALLSGQHHIGIFTVAFLYKNHDALPKPMDFVFVDDVDSLLKSARNIHHVLALLGFRPKDIAMGQRLITLRQRHPEESEQKRLRLQAKAQGVLVVSSATAKPRSQRVHLFRELLGFEVGVPQITLRHVVDVYEQHFLETPQELYESTRRWLHTLGGGGLLFLPGDHPKQAAYDLKTYLADQGITALTYEEPEAAERFRQGRVDYLIGFASWRNPLARGLDMPERVRYALFVGVPKIRLPLHAPQDAHTLLRVGIALLPLLRNTPLASELHRLKRTGATDKTQVRRVTDTIKSLLADENMRRRIESHPHVGLRFENGEPVLIFADVTGYLQASGRTSRLTPAGLTQGLALLLADDEKAFTALQHRLQYMLDEPPRPVDSVNIKEVCRRIDEDRMRVRKGEKRGLSLPSVAVIVESPNKARTLASFFGKPLRRYFPGLVAYEILNERYYLIITATRGHVTDLALEGGMYGVEVHDGFRPRYHPLRHCPEGPVPSPRCRDGRPSRPDRDIALQSIQRLALEVDRLYLATDPDTEGEKIAWDVYLAMRAFNPHVRRIEFHAVTPREFRRALENPRDILTSLVVAQKVRRVADRWIGFTLSHILQRALGKATLSAGRVQTPVLGWVIERAQQAQKRVPVTEVHISTLKLQFPGHIHNTQIVVEQVDIQEEERHPPPPYTTDTLLRDASRAGIPVVQAIKLAQELFEAGYITYHRTDSTHISPEGMALGKRWITQLFGEEYARPRAWGPEGHHEAIRPTRQLSVTDLEEAVWLGTLSFTEKHLRLYQLIVQHFLASQMIPARVRVARYRFRLGNQEKEEDIVVHVLNPGFTLILTIPTLMPHPLTPGTYTVNPEHTFIPAVKPFQEGEIVEEMKHRGIGRPSTYALTVERLFERGYIKRQGPYVAPTRLGEQVYRFLVEESAQAPLIRQYVSESFTRELETVMDEIEAGQKEPIQVLQQLLDVVKLLEEGDGADQPARWEEPNTHRS